MIKFLKADSTFKMVLIMSFTLGLAPFVPEPHIYGKLKWLSGGGVGMSAMDYFDLLFHGTPWLLLILSFAFRKLAK
ncbi:MAG: hypothetical protein JXR10_18140 [Cyclobacteriaceae bacterium]